MNRVLVIGATGNIGRAVVSQLLARDVSVRALTRNLALPQLPPQVDIAHGDLAQPETLDGCLQGIDAAFLVWIAPPATVVPALERITGHARRIVFLSSPYKTMHPLFQGGQPNPIATLHAQIEQLIEGSSAEWTFLRPGMLASNALLWWAPQIRSGDLVRWPYPTAPSAPIHEQDIAAVAVRALCEVGYAGAECVLTGPESLSQAEQVQLIGNVIGRPLRMQEVSGEEALRQLLAFTPAFFANTLLKAWAAAVGHPALITNTVEELTGTPARTFRGWVTDHVAEFRPSENERE